MATGQTDRKPPISVVVIHRYSMVRCGIRATGLQTQAFEVVADTADAQVGFELIDSFEPDLAILDMQLPAHTGFDVLRDLRKHRPAMRVLSYGDVALPDYPERCLRAGAHGYMSLHEPGSNILQAVAKVCSGQIYLSDDHSTALLSRLTKGGPSTERLAVERLSESEMGVLTFVAKGMSNRQIADALHRSVKTVETYRSRIKRKVGIANSTALAQFAIMHFDQSGAGESSRPSARTIVRSMT